MDSLSNSNTLHIKDNGLEYLQIQAFNETKLVKHCFTTKKGGVSNGSYDSLNLGLYTKDKKENVVENYRIILDTVGFEKNFIHSNQVHEDVIEIVDKNTSNNLNGVDGLITNVKGIPLVTFYADCMGLIFLDPSKKVIANSHSGWRGTTKRIGPKTVLKMMKEFGCNSEDILVGVGPSIGQCCFEVNYDVIEEFEKNSQDIQEFCIKKNDKYFINLWGVIKSQLSEVGIKDQNLFVSEICNMCNKDLFFSHRGDKGITGRMAAIIQLI